MIRCQCDFCLYGMDVPDKMAGRKMLCPLCGDPMVIPKVDEEILFKKFVLRKGIEKFRLTDWDRAYARTLLEQKKVPDKELYGGICSYMKAKRKNADLGLAEHLQEREILTAADRDSIRELLKGTVKTVETEYVQCPNCFASVDANHRACKFCGQRISDAALVTCPACKHEQEKSLTTMRCEMCGANLKTGLTEVAKRCPACMELIFGDPKRCPKCKVIVKTSREAHLEEKKKAERRRKLLITIGSSAAAVIILFCVAWGALRTGLRTVMVGGAQASLENTLGDFGKTLQGMDAEELKPFLTGPGKNLAEEDFFRMVCTGTVKGRIVKKISSVTPLEIMMNDDEKGAVVTTALRVTFQRESFGEGTRPSYTRPKTITIEWRWSRDDNQWHMAGIGSD